MALAVVWRVTPSASTEWVIRTSRWKTFRSLESRGVGASRVEKVLAFGMCLGNQGRAESERKVSDQAASA